LIFNRPKRKIIAKERSQSARKRKEEGKKGVTNFSVLRGGGEGKRLLAWFTGEKRKTSAQSQKKRKKKKKRFEPDSTKKRKEKRSQKRETNMLLAEKSKQNLNSITVKEIEKKKKRGQGRLNFLLNVGG